MLLIFSAALCCPLVFHNGLHNQFLNKCREFYLSLKGKKKPSNTHVNACLSGCISWSGYNIPAGEKKYINDHAAEMLVSCSVQIRMKSSKKKTS